MVLGNHDLHLLALAAGVRSPSRSDTLDEILAAPDRTKLLNWLIKQPLIHHQYDHTLVHAGIPPQWSVAEAMGYAREVETVLRSKNCVTFLRDMYGNEPAQWSDDLTGNTRLRVITNYLTRMRYCSKDGVLDLESKGITPNATSEKSLGKVAPWFSNAKRKTAHEKILFGHWASLNGCTNDPNVIGLDTGCVWDGALSLYHLESGTLTSCQCRQGKCRETTQ